MQNPFCCVIFRISGSTHNDLPALSIRYHIPGFMFVTGSFVQSGDIYAIPLCELVNVCVFLHTNILCYIV